MRLPAQLLRRKVNSHKGDFGQVFVIGGSRRYAGAPILAGYAAIRSGAGLVTLGIPAGLNNAVIKAKPKELMTFPLAETTKGSISVKAYTQANGFLKDSDVLLVGPGLSQHALTQQFIRMIVRSVHRPMVIDADGLNALKGHLDILRNTQHAIRNTKILTPHPGEMARLLGRTIRYVQSYREKIASQFSLLYNVTVVLKGNRTIVAGSNGDFFVNKTGNPGMATAGSGDVLSGIIAAFLAQGLMPFDAAKYAVYLHGLAGDLAAKEKTQLGMIASDIIEKIPLAIKRAS